MGFAHAREYNKRRDTTTRTRQHTMEMMQGGDMLYRQTAVDAKVEARNRARACSMP